MARATAQAANFTVKKLGGFKGVKSNCPDCSGAGEMEFVEGYDDQQALVSIPCETCKGVNL
jgi:DnaJ-class molecular chaperone